VLEEPVDTTSGGTTSRPYSSAHFAGCSAGAPKPAPASLSKKWFQDALTAAKLIMPDVLARERELATQKWFDYRFMTPLSATMLFARLYRTGFREHVRSHLDLELAKRVTGVSLHAPDRPSSTFTQLWLARQKADQLGVPYEFVIQFGFDFAGRRKRKYPPRPIQLFASAKTEVAWQPEFEKYLERHFLVAIGRGPELAQYRLEHYRSLPAQIAFRAFMLNLAGSGGASWSVKIASHCLERRHLPLWSLLHLVPRDFRSDVVSSIRHDIQTGMIKVAPRTALPNIAFAPSCLGLRDARDAMSAECVACHLADKCELICAGVVASMIKKHGAASPVAARRLTSRREKTRDRVRKHRKKKAILSSTHSGASV
jgi:hypothetical protein